MNAPKSSIEGYEVTRPEFDNHTDLLIDITADGGYVNASPITLYNRGVRDTLYIHRDGYTVSFFKDGDGPVVVTSRGTVYKGDTMFQTLLTKVQQDDTMRNLMTHNREAWCVYVLTMNLDCLPKILP